MIFQNDSKEDFLRSLGIQSETAEPNNRAVLLVEKQIRCLEAQTLIVDNYKRKENLRNKARRVAKRKHAFCRKYKRCSKTKNKKVVVRKFNRTLLCVLRTNDSLCELFSCTVTLEDITKLVQVKHEDKTKKKKVDVTKFNRTLKCDLRDNDSFRELFSCTVKLEDITKLIRVKLVDVEKM